MSKTSFMFMFLVAAVALPYALSSSSGLRELVFNAVPSGSGENQASDSSPSSSFVADEYAAMVPAASVSQQPMEIYDIASVLRFDVTKPWIMDHWSRVSTTLSELELQGYRVALVTGTLPTDLAGSLTYFFNPEQEIERIEFHGLTGDARNLVSYLIAAHGFEREQTPDPALILYNVKEYGETISEVRIKPMRVIRRENPNARYEVSLVLRKQ